MTDIFYINSAGQKISLTQSPYKILTDTDLFTHEWAYETRRKRFISGFDHKMVKHSVRIVISDVTLNACRESANKLLDFFEIDVIRKTPGRLYVNGSYLTCYFFGNKNPGRIEQLGIVEYTLVSETGSWIEETEHYFSLADASTVSKRYYNRYPYRYANGLRDNSMVNSHFADSDFELRVFGPVVNPQIIIGGHQYLVNTYLEAGEYMTIDSRTRTIKKTMNNGTIVNLFDNRDKKQSVFRKIPPGINSVSWSGKFEFLITLYAERSEPRWR